MLMMQPYVLAYLSISILAFAGLSAIDLHGYLAKPEKQHKKSSSYNPKVLLILPVRGIDLTLGLNLKAFKHQDYRNYKILAVVDDEKDLAVPILEENGINYITAKRVCGKCSGKVNAILTVLQDKSFCKQSELFVVADSDITVKSNWLAELVAPLRKNGIGISTTFPKFVPYVQGFWSDVKMVWGFVGLSLLENSSTRFAWGGSMAFRKELVCKSGIRFFIDSGYGLSDDVSITKLAKHKGLGIAYSSAAQPIVSCKESFGSFAEWANRQTAFTLLGYRKNLYYGLLFYCSEILVFISAFALLPISPFFLIFLLHALLSIWKDIERSGSKNPAIALIALLMPFIYAINLVWASRMEEIQWRGRSYRIQPS